MLLLVLSIGVVIASFLLSSYICYTLIKLGFGDSMPSTEQVILSAGFGPTVVVTMCYYLLLFSPFDSALAYVITVLTILSGLALWLFVRFRADFLTHALAPFSIWTTPDFELTPQIPFLNGFNLKWGGRHIDAFKVLVLFIFIYIVIYWLEFVANKPLTGHDVLEYALLANTFVDWLDIDYEVHIVNEQTGFYFLGLHGYGFPLLGFWEKAVNSVFEVRGDYFFRAATGYYSFLTVMMVYYFLKRQFNLKVAMVSLAMLFSSYAFYLMVREYHIDALRMFTLLGSWLLLFYAWKSQNRYTMWILGAALGICSFVHSINFMISCFVFLALVLFLEGTMSERLKKLAGCALTFILFGAIHYLLDLAIGSGWILKDFLGR